MSVSQRISQHEAISKAAYTDYTIIATDERNNPNDPEQIRYKDAGNNAINELLKRRKEIAKRLLKEGMAETKDAMDLFEYINNQIREYLFLQPT
jgi:hypothetical protein